MRTASLVFLGICRMSSVCALCCGSGCQLVRRVLVFGGGRREAGQKNKIDACFQKNCILGTTANRTMGERGSNLGLGRRFPVHACDTYLHHSAHSLHRGALCHFSSRVVHQVALL